MRVFGETDRMNVMLDTDLKQIVVTQKWKFDWRRKLKDLANANWNERNKDKFKREAVEAIQRMWSSKVYVTISGNSAFAQAYSEMQFIVRISIEETFSKGHWDVIVYKTHPSENQGAYVSWYNKTIRLTSEDVLNVPRTIFDRQKQYSGLTKQYGIAHEFGHAMGNVKAYNTGDEYYRDSPHFDDFESIMNLGNEVRHRHYGYVIQLLEKMLPETKFEIKYC